MSIKLTDLIKNPNRIDELNIPSNKCCYCNVILSTTLTGKNKVGRELCCDDCYYEKIGEIVERN